MSETVFDWNNPKLMDADKRQVHVDAMAADMVRHQQTKKMRGVNGETRGRIGLESALSVIQTNLISLYVLNKSARPDLNMESEFLGVVDRLRQVVKSCIDEADRAILIDGKRDHEVFSSLTGAMEVEKVKKGRKKI